MSESEEASDVLPRRGIQILMALWLLLLGVRWLFTPFLLLGDPAVAQQVVGWDRGPLLHCYQILLGILLLVYVLRVIRHRKMSPNSAQDVRIQESHSVQKQATRILPGERNP